MKLWLLAPMALFLGGCSQVMGASADCAGTDSTSVTLDLVRDQILKKAGQQDEGDPSLSKSKIRATVRQLVLSLEDVRTSKDDPNSTKQFCTGRLKLIAPADMLSDANQTRELAELNSIEDLAENANVEANANAFTAEIDFNVQPTDDGDKIYSQLESGNEVINFVAEFVKNVLLKSAVADAKAEQDRIAAEQQSAELAATQGQLTASFEEAKAENKMAIASINAIWRAVPADARARMLDVQLAWGKRKDATCRVEAASGATSEAEIQIARLRCDTREQNARANELSQYAMTAINEDSNDTE